MPHQLANNGDGSQRGQQSDAVLHTQPGADTARIWRTTKFKVLYILTGLY